MIKYLWLMRIATKHTGAEVTPVEEFITDTGDWYFAAHRYADKITEQAKYTPSLRRKLEEAGAWYVDYVLIGVAE